MPYELELVRFTLNEKKADIHKVAIESITFYGLHH